MISMRGPATATECEPIPGITDDPVFQILLRGEMAIETAMGEASRFHQIGDPNAVDPAFAKQLGRRLHDACAVLRRPSDPGETEVRSVPHTRPRSLDQQARTPSEHGMTSVADSSGVRSHGIAGATLAIRAEGPFAMTYVNPADDPRRKH